MGLEEVDNRGEEEVSVRVVELAGKRGKKGGEESEETSMSGLGGSERSRGRRRQMCPEGATRVEEGKEGGNIDEW